MPAGAPLARRRAGDPPLRLHVNLSAAELRDPELIAERAGRCSRRRAWRPSGSRWRSPRRELLDDAAASAARFRELRALGIRIALDDFGTGYSSLSYLHSLPLDSLKIAKPFVDGLAGDGHDASFIGVIVELARKLELDVIAEGIETAGQLDALRDLGVEFGQGFLIGRPRRVQRSSAAPSRGSRVARGRRRLTPRGRSGRMAA